MRLRGGRHPDPSSQPGLFDSLQAVTTEAIDRGFRNANEEWKHEAAEAVERVSHRLHDFTTDDVEKEIPRWCFTHDLRALGGIMTAAAAAGICRRTDEFRKTTKKIAHLRPKRVWRSLIMWTQ